MQELSGETGITPAYAGKSALRLTAKDPSGDHPRVCGEKADAVPPSTAARGSPPRMRGKDICLLLRCAYGGITPAYAGKS